MNILREVYPRASQPRTQSWRYGYEQKKKAKHLAAQKSAAADRGRSARAAGAHHCAGCTRLLKGSDTVIRAKAFSTGTTIELPLSAELNESDFVSYGGYQFTTKKKLSALSKLITKNNEGITAETYTNSYGECGVYTKTNESGGTDSWCLYVKDPKNTNEKWYFFMGEHREIALDSGTLDLLLPLHLITDASLRDTMFAAVQPGTPYTCGIDKLPDRADALRYVPRIL